MYTCIQTSTYIYALVMRMHMVDGAAFTCMRICMRICMLNYCMHNVIHMQQYVY